MDASDLIIPAACAYGAHRSAIYGIVQPMRGFAWYFAVLQVIVRFREVQRGVLRTGHRMWRSKSPATKKALDHLEYAAQGKVNLGLSK